MYMIWLQAIDPYLTNPSRNFYEGFSCGIRYEQNSDNSIRSNYIYTFGYRGVDTMMDSTGRHDELIDDEKTEEYPWAIDES